MNTYTITAGGAPSDEEMAALVAAIVCLLEAEAGTAELASDADTPAGWQQTAKLLTQGMLPIRLPVAPTWSRIERLRRAGRGGSGVVGL